MESESTSAAGKVRENEVRVTSEVKSEAAKSEYGCLTSSWQDKDRVADPNQEL